MKNLKLLILSIISLIGCHLSAQEQRDTVFSTVTKRLSEYRNVAPSEKLYVHHDRTVYRTGETLWFKVYQFFDGQAGGGSGVVYVDLVDGMNQSVIHSKWKLRKGSATGQLELPDTLHSGNYQLRAYTLWMQNFDRDGFFTREISILSSPLTNDIETDFSFSDNEIIANLRFLQKPADEVRYRIRFEENETDNYSLALSENGDAFVKISLPDSVRLRTSPFFIIETATGRREFPIPLSPSIEFALFPEGGNLVAGLSSRVAFKLTDRQGKGLEGEGVIVDEKGKEMSRFRTKYPGVGTFELTPENGIHYKAIVKSLELEKELPEIIPNGVVMRVLHTENIIRIHITHTLSVSTDPLFLIVHQDGTTYFRTTISLKEPEIVVDIPFNRLPAGIFTATLFDNRLNVHAERLVFATYPERVMLALNRDIKEYGKRQKVTLQFQARHPDGRRILNGGDFSLAVVKEGLDAGHSNFYTHYFLTAGLKGRIDNPDSYFDRHDLTSLPRLDLLLMTHGWRRYAWEEMIQAEKPRITYPAEKGLTFSGQVYLEDERQKVEDIEVTTVFRHEGLKDYLSFKPAPNGSFMFTDYDFTDTAEVLLSATYRKRLSLNLSVKHIAMQTPDYYDFGQGLSREEADAHPEPGESRQQGIDERIHELPEVSVYARAKFKPVETYLKLHDSTFVRHSYETDNKLSYVVGATGGEFGTLGALGILYHVPGVMIRSGGREIRVAGTDNNQYILGKQSKSIAQFPLFLLDGKKVMYEDLKMLSPFLIDRVEVLNPVSAMLYDRNSQGGAIAFYTKSRNEQFYTTPSKTISYKFPGYNQKKEFYSPNYGTLSQDDSRTDQRNTLYWQPQITVNSKGVAEIIFYTTDEPGSYSIRCEGRSDSGVIGVLQTSFITH
jgi:hypothetical protein